MGIIYILIFLYQSKKNKIKEYFFVGMPGLGQKIILNVLVIFILTKDSSGIFFFKSGYHVVYCFLVREDNKLV